MPFFSPLLRLFMVFLNMYDTFKTLKEPPSKYRRTAEGEFYGPSPRAVVQRKRDLKGCLAVWIIWCCFTLYERILEPIVYLFIPFYDEFKAIALLFLILTRARGAEPIFLHLIRPFIRPYTKTIDSALELARMIGDMLFALVLIPLDLLKPWIKTYVPWLGRELPPNGEIYQEYRRQEFTNVDRQNGIVQSYVDETRIYEMRASQQTVISQEYLKGEHLRPLSEPALHQQLPPYLHPAATMSMPTPTYFTNLVNPAPPTPDEIEADLEWRRYAPLPSAYPPTPQVGSSTLPPKRPAPMDFDAVAEDDEDGQQDFHRSLLPPREPLNPGYGKRGLSDEDDGGSSNSSNTDYDDKDAGDFEMGGHVGVGDNDNKMDTHGDLSEDDESDEDYVGDDDEDDFNVTLRTPRAPLPLNPQAGSTIRTRASARSILADMEKSRQSFLVAPALVTPSTSGQSTSSRLTTNNDGSSLGTRTVDLEGDLGLLSGTESASASVSVSDVSDAHSEEQPPRFHPGPLERTDSALVPDFPERNERKRSHSRSFSPDRTIAQLPSRTPGRQEVQEEPNNMALTQTMASIVGPDGRALRQLSSTSQEEESSLSDADEIGESDEFGKKPAADEQGGMLAGKLQTPTKRRGTATGKRRKIGSKASIATNPPRTRISRPTRASGSIREVAKASLLGSTQRKPAPSSRGGSKASVRKSRIEGSVLIDTTASRSTRSSSRFRSASSNRREDSESSSSVREA